MFSLNHFEYHVLYGTDILDCAYFYFLFGYVGDGWVRRILFSPHFVFCPKERVTLVFCRNILCIFAITSPEKLRFNLYSKIQ